jgi:glycosyltransferase involved in cell wall biosynthesis
MDHTFAIPVYRSAPHLGALVDSLRAQTATGSDLLLATSTPSTELEQFARRERLTLHVNPRRLGIAADWNFALESARTALITLAHQDDVFAPAYLARLLAALRRHPGAVMGFSDYVEHTPLGPRPSSVNLRLKRALSERAFRGRECISESHEKLRLLSLGNPICCPSVVLNRAGLAGFRFPEGFQTNLDWMAWLELARRPGGFVYVRERLISKGVHAGSETTATIANRARLREDRVLFEALWPKPVAVALSALYRLGYFANRVGSSPVALADADHPAGDQGDAGPLQR